MNFDNLFNDSSAFIGLLAGFGFIIGITLQYFYLKNLSDLLKAIREPNRKMPPGQVWLLLVGQLNIILTIFVTYIIGPGLVNAWVYIIASYAISVFMVIWQLRMVYRIADSIEAEYDSRKIPIEHRPSFQTGMCMAGGNAASLLKRIPGIGFLGSIGGLIGLIGWIAYWVRTHKYKKEIQAMPEYMEEGESLIFSNLN